LARSIATFVLILFEAAIGAGLVLGELVVDDDSVARAVVIALHLSNTLMLTAAGALTAWWAGGRGLPQPANRPRLARLLALGLVLIVLTAMSGAVTALGDTLFPIEPTLGSGLLDELRHNLSPANHFLVRLRALHPVMALAASGFLIWMLRRSDVRSRPRMLPWARAALGLVVIELLAGGLNIALAAPGWLQLFHLLLANGVWLTTLITAVGSLTPDEGLIRPAR
jgi:heme A synthase